MAPVIPAYLLSQTSQGPEKHKDLQGGPYLLEALAKPGKVPAENPMLAAWLSLEIASQPPGKCLEHALMVWESQAEKEEARILASGLLPV